MKMYRLLVSCFFSVTVAAQGTAIAPQASAGYRLQSGDSIEVLYRYTPEFNQTATVQPDGTVSLQLIGNLPLGGLSLSEANDQITSAAAKRLLNPEVALSIKDFQGPHFTVVGEVERPGRFDLRGDLSPVDAIAIAGGIKVSGKHTSIVLIHRLGPTTGEAQLLNIKQLEHVSKGRARSDLPKLRDGDVLVIPERNLTKIERIIKLPPFTLYYPI